MSLTRSKSPPWGSGAKLTSGEANAMDAQIENALDKRSGQTDNLGSVVGETGSGRVIPSTLNGLDADTTYAVTTARVIRLAGFITANRTYTLSTTGAFLGDKIKFTAMQPTTLGAPLNFTVTIQNTIPLTLIKIGPNADALWAEFLYNGSAWEVSETSAGPTLRSQTFTSSGSFTVPDGVSFIWIEGCGGGGGGGGGTTGDSTTGSYAIGGGGGGGAVVSTVSLAVSPGGVFAVTIGAGGTGGAADTKGNDGSDTVFGAVGFAVFGGAQGGSAFGRSPASTTFGYCEGGRCVRLAPYIIARNAFVTAASGSGLAQVPTLGSPACGGFGVSSNVSTGAATTNGASNQCGGYTGGAGGTNGSASGSHQGGGGGGGGGAGPFGNGGAAGNGGNGNSAGAGVAGTAGSNASANTGAGGGGGGAGGAGTSGGAGGAGGNGGSGYLRVFWVK